jgi:hypothetical protein
MSYKSNGSPTSKRAARLVPDGAQYYVRAGDQVPRLRTIATEILPQNDEKGEVNRVAGSVAR